MDTRLVTLAIVAAVAACSPTATTPATPAHSEALRRADRALTRLLLPNTMARTMPRTQEEIDGLLAEVSAAAAEFARTPESSVQFLQGALWGATGRDDEDMTLSALQVLHALNTPAASSVIREAQTHPDPVVARAARSIVERDQDLLWGFQLD